MSSRKLTKQQQRQIQLNKSKKLTNYKHKIPATVNEQDTTLGQPQQGRIVLRHAMHANVENAEREVFRCNLRRSLTEVVVGDNVIWRESTQPGTQKKFGVIDAIQPRKNFLARPDYYDGLKPIAANIDQVFIVSAILPSLSFNIIDRYLIGCETAKIPAIIVINKIELLNEDETKQLENQLAIYNNIGYKTLLVSSYTGENLEQLHQLMLNKTSIFVGQSGVGKSSLINKFMPELEIATKEISNLSNLGQHTTTVSNLYHLPNGGDLIDSPGIREFGLWHLTQEQITQGYIEFHAFLGGCKFKNCKHENDPGCLLQQAVSEGKIAEMRFENYHRLIASLDNPKKLRHFNTEE